MQKWIIPLKNITLQSCYKLYEKGYTLEFFYKGIMPYVEICKRG